MARRTPPCGADLSFLALVPLLVAGLAGSGSPQTCPPALEYGINPSFQTWTSRAIVFADAFQRVRQMTYWRVGPLDPVPLIPVGSGRVGEGWPDPREWVDGLLFGAPLFGSMEGTIPDGRQQPYVVTWRGFGRVRIEGPAVIRAGRRTDGRAEFYVDPTQGSGNEILACSWVSRNPSDPVRDIHVWLPGMEPTASHPEELFWPPYLEKMQAMNAGRGPETIRTLDWSRVNEVGRSLSQGGFALDRTGAIRPSSPSQGTLRGVCTEYQVALCNALGANLHYQVPHRTDDLTVTEYLDLVADELLRIRDGAPGVPGVLGGRRLEGLRPDLTVTLELSNEMWNPGFPVTQWIRKEALANGLSPRQQTAAEIQPVFDLARAIFAGADAGRLRTYVGGFMADPSFLGAILRELRPGTRIDAVGAAAYLAPRRPEMDAWLVGATSKACPSCPTADDLLAVADAAVDALQPRIARHAQMAATWTNPDGSTPRLELYEAGLNMKSENMPWDLAAHELQVRPEVFSLLSERFVPMLVAEGVARVSWYSFMTDQNSNVVDTYGFWNDMNQAITLPVTLPYVHEGAPKAALLCLGPPPSADCPRASATLRATPGGVDSLRAGPPVLGQRLEASVDVTTTGHRGAYVVVTRADAPALALASATGELFPLQEGPVSRWSVAVPNDPALAGVALTAQAVHVGNQPSAALSNQIELVFGR